MRKCLADEFSSIYILNLRGDIRKNMLSKGRAQEGQNIFGSGSMTGISIALFIKNPQAKEQGQLHYHNIGDDLKTSEKLEIIQKLGSIAGITEAQGWETLVPDEFGDWLNLRDPNFDNYLVLGEKRNKAEQTIFDNYSNGLKTNCDAWVYNSSSLAVDKNMSSFIRFYKSEMERYTQSGSSAEPSDFIKYDSTKIGWHSGILPKVRRGRFEPFNSELKVSALYRPFYKQCAYYSSFYNQRVAQLPAIFPHAQAENLVICVSGVGARSGFSALMSKTLPDLELIEKSQCFPLYLYEINEECSDDTSDLFSVYQALRI